MDRKKITNWMTLLDIDGVGRERMTDLLDRFGSPENVLNQSVGELKNVGGIGEKIAVKIKEEGNREKILKYLDKIDDLGAEVLTVDSDDYPDLLARIPDPPLILYVWGNKNLLTEPSIAVVGSRKASTYGRSAAEKLGADLARAGLCVVSGMARGIDSCSHLGALSVQGNTVAVLGSGLDVPYPREKKGLMKKIISQGLVVTEYPPGTSPEGGNFPERNRIISGLSKGTVVVEAAEKSGSLITADLALDQNREVFAVPGNITSRTSVGSNYLIKKGAKLVQTWKDVIEEFDIETEIKNWDSREKKDQSSPEEELILDFLTYDEPFHIDKISENVEMETSVILTHLLSLELQEKVKQLPGKKFVKKYR